MAKLFELTVTVGEVVFGLLFLWGLGSFLWGVQTFERFGGHRRRQRWIGGLVLMGAATLPTMWVSWHENRWANYASDAFGVDVDVRCRSWIETNVFDSSTAGQVSWERDAAGNVTISAAELSPEVCAGLYEATWNPAGFDVRTARAFGGQEWAVHVLAHEAAHVSGIWNESAAECEALDRAPALLAEFGVAQDEIDDFRTWYNAFVRPKMPSQYRQGDCPTSP